MQPVRVKGAVSARYLDDLKRMHGDKRWRGPPTAFMTGDGRPGSIGEAIRLAIIERGGYVSSFQGDVRHDIPQLIDVPPLDCQLSEWSGYNTLVMCHGVTYLEWFEVAPFAALKEIIDVNLTGSINIAQAFVKQTIAMPNRKKIIMIGSMAHKAVLNGSAAYCASKAGLAHLSACLAWELAPKGYDVYCIHPSNVDGSPMSEETIQGLMRYRELTRGAAESYWNDSSIREQSLTTGEIANLVMYLLSDQSAYLSGCQIDLGGGQR